MRFFYFFVLVLLAGLLACTTPEAEPEAEPLSRAQVVIDDAIATHGGTRYLNSVIEFDFRGRHFRIGHDENGGYTYERTYTDSTGRAVREVLSPSVVQREIDGQLVKLTGQDSSRINTDLNSVSYFAVLPYRLNDPAVRKEYLGGATVEDEPYHKVEVTFVQEGGGRDWEDRFVYWIHRDRHTMDYLAYRYGQDSDDTRFRRAINPREVGGIRFADYENYYVDSLGVDVGTYDALFEAGQVEPFSDIVLENVTVTPAS